jgi:hypothetical protein
MSAFSTIAVMRSALPAEMRFALVAAHPTSPLAISQVCRSQKWLRQTAAIARHHEAVAVQPPTIAAMCSYQSLCLVATTHHRLLQFVSFVGSVSGHGMLPCPSTTKLSPGVPGSCGHRTLRQHASLLHNATLHKVHASQSPSSFGGHAPLARPIGFTQQALCKVAYAGSGRQLSALPGRFAPYAPPPAALWVCLHGGFSQALCAVLSVSGFAVSLVLAPAHPWARLLRKHRLRGLPVRPPRGLPQNRAKTTPCPVTDRPNLALRQATLTKIAPSPKWGMPQLRVSWCDGTFKRKRT